MTGLDTSPRELFPEDLWREVGFPDTGAALAQVPDAVSRIERFHGARRDPALLQAFVEQLPAGRILVHGTGTHSDILLPLIRARRGLEAIGFVDRRAETLGEVAGLPVLSPAEAARSPADYILLSHTSYEMEMGESLLDAGVAPARIVPIYAHSRYRALADQRAGGDLERLWSKLGGRPIDTVVVTCSPTVVVGDHDLAAVADPARTLQIYVGREDGTALESPFETVSVAESLDLLKALLLRLRPVNVYVRSILYKNFLGMLIRHWLPQAVIAQEFYDYAACWPDADLTALFGLSATSIRLLRLSEFYSSQSMDLVLSKRGGAGWGRVQARCAAPYRLHYPVVREMRGGEPPAGMDDGGGRGADFVYAGFLPAPSFLRHYTSAYNFLPILTALCAAGGWTADIYNSAHVAGAGDAVYADYLRDYADGPVRYRRRLPYETLLETIGRSGYGWLADHHSGFYVDRHVGICNRWTGYLSAGLPVVLDAGWTLMADLVRRFDAGLVPESLDTATLLPLLQAADHQRLAQGARRLRSHLLAHNAATQGILAETFARGRA